MKIQFNDNNIVVTSSEPYLLYDLMDFAEKHIDQAKDKYPKDWHYIMECEDYGRFFADGSPQIGECGWKFTYIMTATETSLTISGLS